MCLRHDGGGPGLVAPGPRLELDLEALGALEDDVGLEPEVLLLDGRPDAEVPQDRRQEDLELEHGVLAADAGTRPRGERHEGVVVPVGRLLREEVVRVEDVGVRVDVRLPVELERRDDDRAARRDRVVARCCGRDRGVYISLEQKIMVQNRSEACSCIFVHADARVRVHDCERHCAKYYHAHNHGSAWV